MDGRVLLFTLALTLICPFLFGLVPALGAGRTDLTQALREGVRSGGGPRRIRARRFLVATQVALAVVLVTTAGLMFRSLGRVVDGIQSRRAGCFGAPEHPITTNKTAAIVVPALLFTGFSPPHSRRAC